MLTGKTCGPGTPASIAVALSAQSQSTPKCANSIVSVPLGSTVLGCQFTLPLGDVRSSKGEPGR